MQKKKEVIAILTADWHLSERPPVYRSAEPNWFKAMLRPLKEIEELAEKHNCPILVAGDILDKWNCSAHLLNWVYQNIKFAQHPILAIPGQHDTPNHNPDEIGSSGLFTLHLMGFLQNISLHKATRFDASCPRQHNLTVYPFPFGIPITTPNDLDYHNLNVALVHDYVWIDKCSYPGAPAKKEVTAKRAGRHMRRNRLYGFDVIVFGDNHKGFITKVGDTTIFNCGTLMRRKTDEMEPPWVGLLRADGTVKPYCLNTKQDKYLAIAKARELEKVSQDELDMTQLAQELKKLGSSALDVAELFKQLCQSQTVSKAVERIIQKAMEK